MPAEPLLTTPELVASLEQWVAEENRSFVALGRETGEYPQAAFLELTSGGGALWLGPGCPVNGAAALGMQGPVPGSDLDALEAFFRERGEPAQVDVCPLADGSLLAGLGDRGFVASGFESQLARSLPAEDVDSAPAPGVEVREAATPEERDVWGRVAAEGFADGSPTEEDRRLGRTMSQRTDAQLFLGYLDGEPAGTGMLIVADGVASFNADSTLPFARRRGVQTALLAHRLHVASGLGVDLARIEAVPGGTSHRNQERVGFRTLYTRVSLRSPRRSG